MTIDHYLNSYAGRLGEAECRLAHAALAVELARRKADGAEARQLAVLRDAVANIGDRIEELARAERARLQRKEEECESK